MNKNRKMTRQTINFILAFCERRRIAKNDGDYAEEYITSIMLSGIYNVLINEGYTRKHLNNFFFFEGESDKHKKRTEQAYKFRYSSDWPEPIRNRKNPSKVVEEFFNEDPAGIKLKKEIDNLSEKFN